MRCAVVILGCKKPFVVELTSNIEEVFGVVVFIPTCAKLQRPNDIINVNKIFFMFLKN
jgi:hypothetical protein